MNVDQYIQGFPEPVAKRLLAIRNLILRAAPEAAESMSYGMPAYRLKGKQLIYFAAFSKHLGVYATPAAHHNFADQLKGYKQGKGSIQFPHNKELPMALLEKILRYKINEVDSK